MTLPLLAAKLYLPQPPNNIVPRKRLIERLNAGVSNKLTLISAPAGFGKSTALSTWIDNSNKSVAWLSLDEGYNELKRFLSYFIAALQTLNPSLGRGAALALQSLDGINPKTLKFFSG